MASQDIRQPVWHLVCLKLPNVNLKKKKKRYICIYTYTHTHTTPLPCPQGGVFLNRHTGKAPLANFVGVLGTLCCHILGNIMQDLFRGWGGSRQPFQCDEITAQSTPICSWPPRIAEHLQPGISFHLHTWSNNELIHKVITSLICTHQSPKVEP